MAFKNIDYKRKFFLALIFVIFAGIIIAAPVYYNPFTSRSYSPLYLISLDSSLYHNSPLEVRRNLAEGLERILAAKPEAIFCFYPLSQSYVPQIDKRIGAIMDKVNFYASVTPLTYIKKDSKLYMKSFHPPADTFRNKLTLGHLIVYAKKGDGFLVPEFVYYKKEKLPSLFKLLLLYFRPHLQSFCPQIISRPYSPLRVKYLSLSEAIGKEKIKKKAIFIVSSHREKEFVNIFSSLLYECQRKYFFNRLAGITIVFLVLLWYFFVIYSTIPELIILSSSAIFLETVCSYFLAHYHIYPDNITLWGMPVVITFLLAAYDLSIRRNPKIEGFDVFRYESPHTFSSGFLEHINYNRRFKIIIVAETYNVSEVNFMRRELWKYFVRLNNPQSIDFQSVNSLVRNRGFLNLVCLIFDIQKETLSYIAAGSEPLFVFKDKQGRVISTEDSLPLGIKRTLSLKRGIMSWGDFDRVCVFNSYLRKVQGGLLNKEEALNLFNLSWQKLVQFIESNYRGARKVMVLCIKKQKK